MRWRTGASSLTLAHLAAIFAGSFVASLLLLRPAKQLYHPATSARYSPPDAPTDNDQIHSSIIVPAYHERDNVAPLVQSVFAALRDPAGTEIIIVDDNSRDGTVEEVKRLRRDEGYHVEVLVRTDEKGLSSAVLRGFERARGQKMIVMDADLQHPPEAVQPLFDALTPETPLALGTRYGEGVSMSKNWPLHRRVISWGARTLARPLTSASDPMTGFFGLTKDQLHRSKPINPSGFKIALELLLKSPHPSTLPEVPYSFGIRTTGSSKLSSKVMLKYVGQLISLYVWAWGVFFHLLVAAGVTVVARVGEKLWRSRRRQLTRGKEYPLGGYHADAGVPPLSPKAKGRSTAGGTRGLTSSKSAGGGQGANSGGLADWVSSVVNGGSNQILERKRFV
ncbi:hypothetical protein JCM10908_007214 [Rhodotorula pacifica]|uniref:dolichyl-phosphate beta-D-mannosyltransferase n=1 Tax=Rhodotorula pacifica TaxID=1495444 RepID=UPI003173AE9D